MPYLIRLTIMAPLSVCALWWVSVLILSLEG